MACPETPGRMFNCSLEAWRGATSEILSGGLRIAHSSESGSLAALRRPEAAARERSQHADNPTRDSWFVRRDTLSGHAGWCPDQHLAGWQVP
jgi:hypothetical protein